MAKAKPEWNHGFTFEGRTFKRFYSYIGPDGCRHISCLPQYGMTWFNVTDLSPSGECGYANLNANECSPLEQLMVDALWEQHDEDA